MIATEMRKSVAKNMQSSPASAPAGDAIELLEAQHREVEGLFGEIEAAGKRAFLTKKKLFETLNEKLSLHMKLEESILYPVAKKIDDDAVLEAAEEHANVKAMLRKLSGIEASDETFDAKIKVLKELIQHHVKEEETKLFPECKKALAEKELTILAQKMGKLVQKNSVIHH